MANQIGVSINAVGLRPVSTADSDGTLVAAARNGEVTAFEAMYEKYHRRIFAHAMRRVSDKMIAEDVAHDTFLKAFTRIWQLRSPDDLLPWLRAISSRLCVDHHRRDSRVVYFDEVRVEPEEDDPVQYIRDPRDIDAVRCALAELPERQRRILVAHVLEEISYRELAEREHTSELAIKSLLFRARSGFRGAWRGAVAWLGLRAARDMSKPSTIVGRLRYAMPALPVIGVTLALLVPAALPPATPHLVRDAGPLTHQTPSPTRSADAPDPSVVPSAMGAIGLTEVLLDRLLVDVHISVVTVSPNFLIDRTAFALSRRYCEGIKCGRRLYLTEDAGSSWTLLPSIDLLGNHLVVPPTFGSVDRTIYAIGTDGVQVSRDGGIRFETVTPPLWGGVNRAVASPMFGRGDDRIVIGGSQVFEYRPKEGLVPIPGTGVGPLFPELVLDGREVDLLVGSLGYRGIDSRSAKIESCSSALCETVVEPGWQVNPTFGQVSTAGDLWAAAGIDQIIIGQADGSIRSVRAPGSWITNFVVTDRAIVAINHGERPGVIVSHDRGRTWQHSQIPGDFYTSITSAGSTVLVAGRDGVWCSSDLGITFSRSCAR
ncbi:MAG: sigma-70 family RNA polymerase sigma factor [Actinomycetota bacterium]